MRRRFFTVALAALTIAWATMRSAAETAGRVVLCPRVKAAPKLDGSVDDPIWRGVPVLTGFWKIRGGPADVQTEIRACYDDQMLYLAALCREPEVGKITAHVKERDDDPRQDDCIEFTLGVVSGRMFHIAVSAGGGLYDAWIDPGGWTDVLWDSDAKMGIRVMKEAWGVELSVPLKRLSLEPKPGTVVTLHVLRYRRQSDEASTLVPVDTDSTVSPTAVVKLKFE